MADDESFSTMRVSSIFWRISVSLIRFCRTSSATFSMSWSRWDGISPWPNTGRDSRGQNSILMATQFVANPIMPATEHERTRPCTSHRNDSPNARAHTGMKACSASRMPTPVSNASASMVYAPRSGRLGSKGRSVSRCTTRCRYFSNRSMAPSREIRSAHEGLRRSPGPGGSASLMGVP